ncbi:unnamed protein product [Orchesella dallaii]|uniref:Uncharacterized protein n=1 Tax=Orchesella dallaii TaxID=48710 RepID=A0ABP1PNW7_9HEXA
MRTLSSSPVFESTYYPHTTHKKDLARFPTNVNPKLHTLYTRNTCILRGATTGVCATVETVIIIKVKRRIVQWSPPTTSYIATTTTTTALNYNTADGPANTLTHEGGYSIKRSSTKESGKPLS